MAAKKNAKKTTQSTPAGESTPRPAAKKATKSAVKKTAATPAAAAPATAQPALAKPVAQATAQPAAAKPVAQATAAKPAAKPSPDAIARAAYLNYRRRVEQGLPGDSDGDWLHAERQLADAG